MNESDIIVIGAGPAGSSCAALCADAGMSVLLLEAARFPRDKVCGDCLNPMGWPSLELLQLEKRIKSLPHSVPSKIRFSVTGHSPVELPIQQSTDAPQEIVIRRRDLDALLLERALEAGVFFQDGSPVTSLRKMGSTWEVTTSLGTSHRARLLVAADGRNSITARNLGMQGALLRNARIGLQTHIPHPPDYDGALEMRIYSNGYGGLADLGNGVANLCLVANEGAMKELRKEAEAYYSINSAVAWRSITPISRGPSRVLARDGVLLCGDAAHVVEPFTGEGISFALRSGTLLAEILSATKNPSPSALRQQEKIYKESHRTLYRSGLWVNRLTHFLSKHPRIAHKLCPILLRNPTILSKLTSKVITTSRYAKDA